MLTSDKHSNLLGQFLSYEEREVLWIRTLILNPLKFFSIRNLTFHNNFIISHIFKICKRILLILHKHAFEEKM